MQAYACPVKGCIRSFPIHSLNKICEDGEEDGDSTIDNYILFIYMSNCSVEHQPPVQQHVLQKP